MRTWSAGAKNLDKLLKTLPADRALSLGLVDGRNIWRTDLQGAFNLIEKTLAARSGDVLQIAPSCSFIHTPVDLDAETKLDAELKNWMAFAEQKLVEVATLAAAATNGKKSVEPAFVASHEAIESRDASARIHNTPVAKRMAAVSAQDLARTSPFEVRRRKQRAALPLPTFPTTTIGSFLQTAEVRKTRASSQG